MSGKTIICTIHQPSSEVFRQFDKQSLDILLEFVNLFRPFSLLSCHRICILAQQKLAYFGTRENALEFFTKNLSKQYPEYTNPADFYMDTIGLDINDPEESKSEIDVNICYF